MSEPSRTADEGLERFGYRQELRRTLGLFASFGIAFSYVSPVVGVYTLFGYGLATGGPAFLWSLPLVVGGQLLVVLVFSEVAASFPLAGALYQWGRRLVGPRYGFFVGWIYGWALVVTIAAVDFGTAPYLASLLGLPGDRGTLVFLALGFTVVAGLVVTSGALVEVRGVNANALLVAYAVAGIYLSVQAVVIGRLIAAARGWQPDGEFRLGRAGVPVAIAALVYGLLMLVNLCWPRPANEVAGWLPLASALAIVVPGALFALARRS